MLNFRENLSEWISVISSKLGFLRAILDIIDIILLSLLLYICFKFLLGIMKKRSGRLLVGIFAVAALSVISYLLNLKATFYVLENVMQFGVIALIVIFQPEIRTLLENVGYAGKSLRPRTLFVSKDEKMTAIEGICKAVKTMSVHNIGALIVFQKDKELNSYDELKAVNINSEVSSELIENIFFKNSPLHDGAVIIRDFRVSKARVLFDGISNNPALPLELGSRHKAAVGATENGSDSRAIVVSEETGQISFAKDGELKQNITAEELYKILVKDLVTSDRTNEKQGTKREKNKAKMR